MVLGQVGEDPHGEADACHPLEKQCVGGYLHHHMGAARVRHAAEKALELKGFRGGTLSGDDLVPDHVLVGADQAHLGAPGLLQDILEQVSGGGLAIGAGDAHHHHGGRRIAVPVPAHLGQGRAAVGNQHVGPLSLRPLLAQHAGRAFFPGHGDIFVPIRLIARHGHKEVPGPRLSRVIADAGDLHLQVGVGFRGRYALQQLTQFHSMHPVLSSFFRRPQPPGGTSQV